ncbi:SPFH domain-containing protein [bacterium]|nr:SPFH domain-containing protein [bacterium]
MRTLAISLSLVVATVAVVAYAFGVVVPPGQYGIRQIGFGPTEGYQPVALQPGYHWGEPTGYLTSVVLVPSTLQAVHFNRTHSGKKNSGTVSRANGGGDEYWFPPINIETVDKGQILVDVTVLARLLPEAQFEGEKKVAGGPADLAENVGVQPMDWVARIRTAAEREVGEALRQLTNAEFYNPELREQRSVKDAHVAMNEALRPFGITVQAVLLRRYSYEVQEVNKAIAEKNLQVQRERLSDFQRAFAEVEAELVTLKAEGEAQVTVIRETAPQEARAIRSEGDLAFAEKRARGDQLIAEAEAHASKLKADVFSEMSEARVYLARELAPLLGTIHGGIVSDLDPYDLEEWMSKFGMQTGSSERGENR